MRRWLAVLVPGALLCVWTAAQTALAPISFKDVVERSGVRFVTNNGATPDKHQVETMLSGVAIFDYNNDGWLDLFFVNGAALPGMDKSDVRFYNRLYRNNKNGTFTDVTGRAGVSGAGYGMGVAAGDYDNDGFEDLYVTGVNRNQLLHNNGNGTFTDVTTKAGVEGIHPRFGKTWAISSTWLDYDNDGYLDLLVINYVEWSAANEPECSSGGVRAYCSPNSYAGQPSMLFHNNGDGTFKDVSDSSGIGKLTGKGMSASIADYDGDGFVDIFVSNDTLRNFLFHNNGDGTFTEVGVLAGVAFNENGRSIAGMGTDFRDVDNDGRPDIFVTGIAGDTFPLFRNTDRGFIDVTNRAGLTRVSSTITGWGAGIFDFDNDGWKDLFASCASVLDNSEQVDHLPSKLSSMVLRNLGNGKLSDVSATAGADFRRIAAHRGAAFGDLNNDGRIDIVVTSLNDRPEIFLNRSPAVNHWILLKLTGTRSNRDAIGAKVKVIPEIGGPQYNHVTTSVGLSSSSDVRVHFGLGGARKLNIEIAWPSGRTQTLTNVAADQILAIREN